MSSYPSDIWLANFPRDSAGSIAWDVFAAQNGYTLFTIGNQAGDLPDYKTAEAKANAVIASGKPAGILFRRGQSFGNECNDSFQTNGISPSLPFLVGSTFDLNNPRPHISKQISIGNARQPTQNIAVFGLDLYDPIHDPGSPTFSPTIPAYPGIWLNSVVADGKNVLLDDIRSHFNSGFALQSNAAYFQTLIVNRCELDHCWQYKAGGPSMGGAIYASAIQDLFINQCTLDHNGWLEPTATWGGWPKNIYWHNLYLQTWNAGAGVDPQTRVVNSILARAAATGAEQRSGGLNDGNLFLGNPIAVYVGPGGNNPTISNAVIDGGGGEFDLSAGPGNPRGWGAFLNYLPTQGTLANVLCINKSDALNGGFALAVKCDATPPTPTNAMLTSNIVHGWTGNALEIDGVPASLTFAGACDLGIPTIAPTKTYVDSTRTTASFTKSLAIAGETNATAFLAAAAGNCRGNWDARFTASAVCSFIRAGFQPK
jgi:hypothetical protein